MVKIRVLGISATPIYDGNCDKLVQYALKEAEKMGDVETEFITTANKEIATCTHCQWCIENMAPCKVQDDLQPIYESMRQADGIIFSSPAWLNTLAPFLLNLFSRARYQVFFTNEFRNKVAGLLTLGFLGFGMEHAIDTLRDLTSCFNMIPVANGSALSSTRAYGQRPAYLKNGVLDDKHGLETVKKAAIRVVEISRMIKFARDAGMDLPSEYQFTVTGGRVKIKEQRIFTDGVWRDTK